MKRFVVAFLLVLVPVLPVSASDSRADASLLFGYTDYHALEENDFAVGVGFGYRLTHWLATDASFSWAPKDLGDPAFSGSRTEGALGVRLGPHLDRSGVYVAARPGFVSFAKPDEPTVCILIFPPPLKCTLSNGETVFSLDLNGGVQFQSDRAVLRLEAGDRVVKYPAPVIAGDGGVHDDSFWSHNFAASVSVGVRF